MLTALVKTDSVTVFENGIYQWLSKCISDNLTRILVIITDLGAAGVIIAASIILLALPVTRARFGIPVAVNAVVSGGLNILLKLLIARDRPNTLRLIAETGYGFPSGHAMNNAALYTILILLTFRRTKSNRIRLLALIYAAVITFLIGVSRVYLGVHNACDVLAGWTMGVVVALLVDMAYATFQSKRNV